MENIVMEEAKIIFRNFEGRADEYNREGSRNFAVVIEDTLLVDKLRRDGWNVREYQRNEEDDILYYLPVAVSYKVAPPKIYSVIHGKRTSLNECMVGELDHAEIRSVDLTIRPYKWKIDNKSGVKEGVKAYLKTMYAVLEEDEFAYKYSDCSDEGKL